MPSMVVVVLANPCPTSILAIEMMCVWAVANRKLFVPCTCTRKRLMEASSARERHACPAGPNFTAFQSVLIGSILVRSGGAQGSKHGAGGSAFGGQHASIRRS